MIKKRSETLEQDRWNVESLYSSLKDWQVDFTKATQGYQNQPIWNELQQFKGKLGDAATLRRALDLLTEQTRFLIKIYTYAHLRHDEDIAENENKVSYNQALTLLHNFQEFTSWFDPELLALPEKTLEQLVNSPTLEPYKFQLEKMIRRKKHTLPPEQEHLIATAMKPLQTAQRAFSALNDADFLFGLVEDSKGEEHTLTHASMGILGRSRDRTLRKNAYLTLHRKYQNHENTLAELLNGQVQNHIFIAKARKYQSSLQAALHPNNIEQGVYFNLIKTVNANLEPLHRYYDLRSKILNLKPLHLYDMTVPITPDFDITMPYEEAEQLVIDSVAPLGKEYQNLLQQGFKEHGWVDRYENKNKRSGAYSSGCYDSCPYILMNYKGLLRDVFTLAHEAGHSMHSLLSHKNQPFQYGDYSIFLAEVASTFNEELLTRHMLKTVDNTDEKIFLINQKIEDIRGTLFRQAMFAEFELLIHETAEKGQPLTPLFLNEAYRKLVAKYMGPNVVIDIEAESEWARIPHFYYNFYVYQYATGISAALALAEKVMEGGAKERDAYLNYLKSGSSRYPLDILKSAGVDMTTPEPIEAAIRTFKKLVDELSELIDEKQAVST